MSNLNVLQRDHSSDDGGGCGTQCGNGLERIYPTLGVRYGAMNWVGEFEYRKQQVFSCGGKVVIQSDRGIELGEQISLTCGGCDKSVSREQIKTYIDNSGPEFYKLRSGRVIREATPEDVEEHERLNSHVREDLDRCALLAAQFMLDMKIVDCEHLLGGERVVFYFRSESRVDFRELVKELARHYQTRIELRQVGARDEARLVADYEICGRECCCKNFLKKLRPVSMKMAKLQKSTLDPSKVSGRCGRLRCCLRYEHEGYEELNKKLLRVNARVETEHGLGVVTDRQVLTQLLVVRHDDGTELAIPGEEVQRSKAPLPPPESRDDDARGPRARGRRDRDNDRGGDGAADGRGSERRDNGQGQPTARGARDAGHRDDTPTDGGRSAEQSETSQFVADDGAGSGTDASADDRSYDAGLPDTPDRSGAGQVETPAETGPDDSSDDQPDRASTENQAGDTDASAPRTDEQSTDEQSGENAESRRGRRRRRTRGRGRRGSEDRSEQRGSGDPGPGQGSPGNEPGSGESESDGAQSDAPGRSADERSKRGSGRRRGRRRGRRGGDRRKPDRGGSDGGGSGGD